jgi:hypothetical protein
MTFWPSFEYVKVHRGAFTAAKCAEFIAAAEKAGFGRGDLGNTRRAEIAWVWSPVLVTKLAAFDCGIPFDVAGVHVGAAQVTRYGLGDCYDWHMDLGAGAMSHRKYTVVLELASAQEGGGLEIFSIGNVGLQRGDAAAFPSFVPHRALKVTRGERLSATLWRLGTQPFM